MAGTIFGIIKVHDANIRHEATLAFNQAQMQKVLAEQEDFRKKTEVLEKWNQDLNDKLDKTNQALDDQKNGIESYINTLKDDHTASDVLKETLRRLGAPK
jgi:septin family protein